jgi:hypothetical protein
MSQTQTIQDQSPILAVFDDQSSGQTGLGRSKRSFSKRMTTELAESASLCHGGGYIS